MVDSNGYSPVSIKWVNFGNIFDLIATIVQLLVGGAAIAGQYAVLNARPNNIGIGYWEKMRKLAIDEFG